MNDITDILNTYRECTRGLWNTYLRPDADFDRVDAFASICEVLFAELVLRPLGKNDEPKKSGNEPYSFLRVVPTADAVPIMINRPSTDGNRYWDDPIGQVHQRGNSLLYIDYFDWDSLGFVDFQYYRVHIAHFDNEPRLLGREALIEVRYAKVFRM
jgi:hypothetical protein